MATVQQQTNPTSGSDSLQPTAGTQAFTSTSAGYNEELEDWQCPNHEYYSEEDLDALRNDFAQFELPLVEYAQLHGLTASYLSHSLLNSDLVPQLPANWQTDLEDSESTLNIGVLVALGALNGQTAHEKLDVDKEAAELLASVIKLGQDDGFLDAWQDDYSMRFKKLILEEPILLSDPKLDLIRLKRRNMAVFSTDGMQPFADHEVGASGFISPEKDATMRDELEKDENERLDIDRSTIEYLGDIYNMLSKDDDDDIEILLGRQKTRLPSPATPPLFPSSPSLNAFAPNVEADEIDFTSSPDDLIREEAAKLERHILDLDTDPAQALGGRVEQADIDFSVFDIPEILDESSSSPFSRKRLKDLKVETPLTPVDSSEPPTKKAKTVSFSEELQTMIPNFESEFAMSDPALGEDDLESFMEGVVEPFAKSADKQLHEERLDELDTTLRVLVSPMEDVALDIPWERYNAEQTKDCRLSSHRMLMSQTWNELTEGEKAWSGAYKIERQLPWTPFPAKLGEVNIDEEFDDGSLPRYLSELVTEDEIDVESLVCAPQELKVLQENEDDPVLEPHEFDNEEDVQMEYESKNPAPLPDADLLAIPNEPVSTGPGTEDPELEMQALVEMRRKELDAAHTQSQAPKTLSGGTGQPLKLDQIVTAQPSRLTEPSTTAGGLANFMRLHGRAFSSSISADPVFEPEWRQLSSVPIINPGLQNEGLAAERQCISLVSPTVPYATTTFFVIVSPTIIADRDLMRELRRSLPELEVVTRDALSSKSNDTKQSVSNEADIATSPSTGIITTNLQKLKQRPLPGQTTFFGVRDRIALISCRYGRLIVLVSEGRTQSHGNTGPLDNHDFKAISDLIGFTSSLESNVEVRFVAGGEPQLAAWLAACISRTIPVDDGITLMQEESIWERLLRQAGMNPFAAQYVLSKLKPKESSTGLGTSSVSNMSSTATFGLGAFVQMSASQRLEMFGQSIGRRVIERVGGVVDGGFIPNPQNGIVRAEHLMQQ